MIGSFLAKIKDYGMGITKTNKPQALVQFEFIHDGQTHSYTWYGTLAPDNNGDRKGISISLKALVAMGMTQEGADRMQRDFFKGPESRILDMEKELKIELQEEPHQTEPGKMVTRVQWVNDPNDVYMIKKLTEAENYQAMAGLDIRGDIFKILQEKGAKAAGPGAQVHAPNNNPNGYNPNQNAQNGANGYNPNQGNGQSNGANVNSGTMHSGQNQGNGYGQTATNNASHSNNGGQQNFNPNQGQANTNGFKPPF